MFRTFLEFYERAKAAAQQKNPEIAVITVEEMAIYAKISRQTMYDYLKRWTNINIITKTSFIKDGKVVIGYKLNGNTLESAYDKARVKITNNLDLTLKYIMELQRVLKNEKISRAQKINSGSYTNRRDHSENQNNEEIENIEFDEKEIQRKEAELEFMKRQNMMRKKISEENISNSEKINESSSEDENEEI